MTLHEIIQVCGRCKKRDLKDDELKLVYRDNEEHDEFFVHICDDGKHLGIVHYELKEL